MGQIRKEMRSGDGDGIGYVIWDGRVGQGMTKQRHDEWDGKQRSVTNRDRDGIGSWIGRRGKGEIEGWDVGQYMGCIIEEHGETKVQ